MKRKLLYTITALTLTVSVAFATTHTVTCQNSPTHFIPVTTNAMVGDTILWTWVAGTHVVGPILTSDIPAGAAMFNAPIDASDHSFKYKVTVAGNYHYVCHPATPHGEDAYLVVSSTATGIQSFSPVSHLSVAYPNPFTDKITIEASAADVIQIYNIVGEEVKSIGVKNGLTKFEVDLGTLPKGVFFYVITKDGIVVDTRKIIKN
jgi:plastocyanin